MLIALSTLPQLASTQATASLPSLKVANLSSKTAICPASAPLRSRSCRRFSSSLLFAAMRVASAEDGCEELELARGLEVELGKMVVGRGA